MIALILLGSLALPGASLHQSPSAQAPSASATQALPSAPTVEFFVGSESWPYDPDGNVGFMCIVSPLRIGVTQQCYGFLAMPTGTLLAAGPTIIEREQQRNYRRPNRLAVQLSRTITAAQRDLIYQTVNRWNAETHAIEDDNCVALIDALATDAGLVRVPLVSGEKPQTYLLRLKRANVR
jgi:hypothetical protein